MYIKHVLKLENQGQLHNHLNVINYNWSVPNGCCYGEFISRATSMKKVKCIEMHLMPRFRELQTMVNGMSLKVAEREIDKMGSIDYD